MPDRLKPLGACRRSSLPVPLQSAYLWHHTAASAVAPGELEQQKRQAVAST